MRIIEPDNSVQPHKPIPARIQKAFNTQFVLLRRRRAVQICLSNGLIKVGP